MNGNELLLTFVNSIVKIINHEKHTIKIDKIEKVSEFDLKFFDNDYNFYMKILSNLSHEKSIKVLDNINKASKSFLRNLVVFLEYLKAIINTNKYDQLYKDPIVKLDISLIIGYLTEKYGEKTIESIEFFWVCIKELESKYKIPYINYVTKFDNELKTRAEEEINNLKLKKILNFGGMLEFLRQNLNDPSETDDLNDVCIILKEYEKNSEIMSFDELEIQYFKNSNYKKYFNLYLEKKLPLQGYIKKNLKNEIYEQKKEQFKNHLFFSDILTIDLNDIENCIYVIYFIVNIYNPNSFFEIDKEFKKLLSRKEIIFENEDYTENLKKIIEEKSFIEDIKEILGCSSVKEYFENVRRFTQGKNVFNINFINEIEMNEDDDDLKDGYNKLVEFLEKDKRFLSKIVIFKYLPKYNRAFVDPNMRIVINPIYFEMSEFIDEYKRNEIFKAYLFIIILHEFVHLIKFMKKEKNSFDNVPKTPKDKEGGKMFINYLFNLPVIYYITDEQASQIIKPENWNNPEILSNIFKEQKEWFEMNLKEHNENHDRPSCNYKDSISFYLSLRDEIEGNESNENNSKEINDDWYDMD